jgi:hypothetical protein
MLDIKTPRIEHRSQLYYGKYQYVIAIQYQGTRYLRSLDPQLIANRYQHFWGLADMPLHELVDLASQLTQLGTEFKRVCGWDTMHFYSNNAGLFDRLSKLAEMQVTDYRTAKVTLEKNKLLLKNPRYKYRSYCREFRVDIEKSQEFLQFVICRGDYLNLDSGTIRRLTTNRYYYPFARHSYIQHNSLMDITMIEMVLPGLIRKTMTVEAK